MNKLSLPIVALVFASLMQSCYKDGPDHKWNRGVAPGDLLPVVVEPIGIDTNGDGKPDKIIDMTNDIGSENYSDGTPVNKECFNNSPSKCLVGGGLYYPADANNKSFEAIFEDTKKALDKDGDGVMDAGTKIADTLVPILAMKLSDIAAKEVVSKLTDNESVAGVTPLVSQKTQEAVLSVNPLAEYDAEKLNTAVSDAVLSIFNSNTVFELTAEIELVTKGAIDSTVKKTITANPAYIDEEQLAKSVKDAVAASIQTVVREYVYKTVEAAIVASLTETSNANLTSADIAQIAAQVAKSSSQNIASDLVLSISAAQADAVLTAVAQELYRNGKFETPPVQGLCPDGYHIPSDREWKEIELSLGMPASEVHLSGIYADRGADVNMAKKFEKALNLQYGGYGTVDGRFAQYGEVSVFATSSVGKDSEGEFVWVRYIDNLGDHQGIIRKKLRKGTLMSVRCIK